jgi:hypothetical protein
VILEAICGFSFAGRSLVLMEKLVIEDGRCQLMSVFSILNRIFAANQPALAKYIAIFLAGDFFGHFEDQFDQRVRRQLLRALEKYARLADVLDQTFVPGTEIFSTVSNRKLGSQAPRSRHPGRLFLAGAAADGCSFCRRPVDPISATHGLPVVLISGRAYQADLVIFSTSRAARPGKLVRTASQHKNIHEFLRHDDE